jgi:hypothetical protein
MPKRHQQSEPPTRPTYRLELLCEDGEWLIVRHNMTRAEADRAIAERAEKGGRYRIERDPR